MRNIQKNEIAPASQVQGGQSKDGQSNSVEK
jgi:hypothetical protein